MHTPSDLMVVLDSDSESLTVLREAADHLGCEPLRALRIPPVEGKAFP